VRPQPAEPAGVVCGDAGARRRARLEWQNPRRKILGASKSLHGRRYEILPTTENLTNIRRNRLVR